jgi:uncharacterized membrane protein YfcA/uncharacterized membrane protein
MKVPTDGAEMAEPRDLVRETELLISGVLRGGVILSAAIILGGIIYFYALRFSGHPVSLSFPHSLPAVFQDLGHLEPLAIVAFGLLVLLATPVLRVAVSIIAFAVEHDRAYVAITALVLTILLFSIFVVGGMLGHGSHAHVVRSGLSFFVLVFLGSLFAGFIGSLVGLGGGVFVVPLLTIAFGVPIQSAIGASIVSVIATSSGAAAAYVRDRITNMRVGMFLEIATTIGAISGALLATVVNSAVLFVVFGLVLLFSVLPLVVHLGEELPHGVRPDRFSRALRLASSYPDHRLGRTVDYEVTGVPPGFGMMYVAGAISGLLGIGSGTFKVLAMDTAMRLPMKVSTTTSNFMIGVTAAASAGIYFQRGDIDPVTAAPVALGVLLGATIGAVTLPRLSNAWVRKVFIPVIVLVAIEMLLRGLGVF